MSNNFNKIKGNFFILFSLMFSFYNCGQNKTINLVKDNFSIEYPSYFNLDESGAEGSVFILKTPFKEGKNSFVENVNMVKLISEGIPSEEYFAKVEKEIGAFGEVIERKKGEVNGRKYLKLVFNLEQGDSNFTIAQQFYAADNFFYILTFSSDTKEFNKYREDVNTMFYSLVLDEKKKH